MISKMILMLLFATSLVATEIKENEKVKLFVLADQFGVYHTVDRHTKTIIVSSEKETGKDINNFLATKPKNYLKKNDAVFIANISKMPSIITRMIAMPRLKEYKHNILLINNEEDNRFAHRDEKITIYKLKNSIVEKIYYINSAKEIEKAF